MATHSSILAWKIPWTEKPGRLQSMGSQRVRHDWATFTFTFSLGGSDCKELPATPETWVRSLGREGPLEKEMATRNSILAWKIPWTEEPGGLQSMGSHRIWHDQVTNTFTLIFICVCARAKLLQLCLTLGNSMGCSLPASSVLEILQERILEWVAMTSLRGSSQPRDRTHVSCLLLWQVGSLPLGHQECAYVNSKLLVYLPPTCFPFGNHKLAFEVWESVSVLQISSLVSFFFLDSTYVISCDIYFCLTYFT